MKIEQRGFGITDISERVAGVDGDADEARIVFVLPAGEEQASRWLRSDDVKALIEALTAAHGLMTGETATVGHSTRKLAGLKDRTGDIWFPALDGGWGTGPGEPVGRTREYVEREWGPVAEVWQ